MDPLGILWEASFLKSRTGGIVLPFGRVNAPGRYGLYVAQLYKAWITIHLSSLPFLRAAHETPLFVAHIHGKAQNMNEPGPGHIKQTDATMCGRRG